MAFMVVDIFDAVSYRISLSLTVDVSELKVVLLAGLLCLMFTENQTLATLPLLHQCMETVFIVCIFYIPLKFRVEVMHIMICYHPGYPWTKSSFCLAEHSGGVYVICFES